MAYFPTKQRKFSLSQIDCTVTSPHRFVCDGTVEDKISSLQEKKKELAQKVLSGTGSSFTKLSLADLRVIFGVWYAFYYFMKLILIY